MVVFLATGKADLPGRRCQYSRSHPELCCVLRFHWGATGSRHCGPVSDPQSSLSKTPICLVVCSLGQSIPRCYSPVSTVTLGIVEEERSAGLEWPVGRRMTNDSVKRSIQTKLPPPRKSNQISAPARDIAYITIATWGFRPAEEEKGLESRLWSRDERHGLIS